MAFRMACGFQSINHVLCVRFCIWFMWNLSHHPAMHIPEPESNDNCCFCITWLSTIHTHAFIHMYEHGFFIYKTDKQQKKVLPLNLFHMPANGPVPLPPWWVIYIVPVEVVAVDSCYQQPVPVAATGSSTCPSIVVFFFVLLLLRRLLSLLVFVALFGFGLWPFVFVRFLGNAYTCKRYQIPGPCKTTCTLARHLSKQSSAHRQMMPKWMVEWLPG